MTIKQVLIGTLVGSSIIALTIHRIPTPKGSQSHPRIAEISKLEQRKRPQPHKVAYHQHQRTPWLSKKYKGSSNPQISSQKLYVE